MTGLHVVPPAPRKDPHVTSTPNPRARTRDARSQVTSPPGSADRGEDHGGDGDRPAHDAHAAAPRDRIVPVAGSMIAGESRHAYACIMAPVLGICVMVAAFGVTAIDVWVLRPRVSMALFTLRTRG